MENKSRHEFLRRAIRLEYFTVGWNVVEAIIAVGAGILAGSIALIGFGLDSVIESLSGVALLWRLRWERNLLAGESRVDAEVLELKERRALRIVGWTFLALSAYVAFEAIQKLWRHERPEASVPGIALLSLSTIVMPLLAAAKFRTARDLRSSALRGDAKETLVCSVLSVITLGGLGLNALLGWWWADPVAALAMVPWLVKEGTEAIRGECC